MFVLDNVLGPPEVQPTWTMTGVTVSANVATVRGGGVAMDFVDFGEAPASELLIEDAGFTDDNTPGDVSAGAALADQPIAPGSDVTCDALGCEVG